jgi:hypothetical protein
MHQMVSLSLLHAIAAMLRALAVAAVGAFEMAPQLARLQQIAAAVLAVWHMWLLPFCNVSLSCVQCCDGGRIGLVWIQAQLDGGGHHRMWNTPE